MDNELNQINVIPLVDVMLVLLVIVLTTATFITTGQIPVNLAKASESVKSSSIAIHESHWSLSEPTRSPFWSVSFRSSMKCAAWVSAK